MVDRPSRVHRTMRVNQLDQTDQQITDQIRAGQPIQGEPCHAGVTEHTLDPHRIGNHRGRHQSATMVQASSSPPNSTSLSCSAAASVSNPCAIPACS